MARIDNRRGVYYMARATKYNGLELRARRSADAMYGRRDYEPRREHYLAGARHVDRTRQQQARQDTAHRRLVRRIKTLWTALLLLFVASWVFGSAVWLGAGGAILLGLAVFVAGHRRQARRLRADVERERAAEEARQLRVDAKGWVAWSEENDLPMSAEVWRALAADTID